ncbi:MAG: hypothetical protein OXI67_07750 [Candidatus Poribacteria bacterium]|nr:hypothetical protein [Candidatus Poribacteria bacterium]
MKNIVKSVMKNTVKSVTKNTVRKHILDFFTEREQNKLKVNFNVELGVELEFDISNFRNTYLNVWGKIRGVKSELNIALEKLSKEGDIEKVNPDKKNSLWRVIPNSPLYNEITTFWIRKK